MTIFEQAWPIVKMPIYETGIPGIKFVTQGKGDPNWSAMDNVFGYVPSGFFNNFEGEPTDFGQSEIKSMTPADYLTRITGNKRGHKYGGVKKRKEGPLMQTEFDNIYDSIRYENKNREKNKQLLGYEDSEGNFVYYKTPKKTPREIGDYFYRDLMDRAQAGEDILFGMPYIWPDMDDPGHEGVHRMSELFARGHGHKPVPVKVTRGK